MKKAHILNKKHSIYIWLPALLLTGMIGCKNADKNHHEFTASKTDSIPPEEVVLLRTGSLIDTLAIPGELTSYQKVDIYAKVNSFVKKVFVDIGSKVTAGQLLATMEAPEITSQMSAAFSRLQSGEATYTASKAYYNRLLETSKTPGTVSPNDLEQAKARSASDYAQYLAAKANYAEVGVQHGYLTIRAPFNGIISARNINPGAYVGPSGSGDALPMLTLQQQTHLRLMVSVPEAYSNVLKIGDAVDFHTKSLPNKTFHAKVSRLSGALDSKLRSEKTEMDVFSNGDLLPGMTVEVNLPLPSSRSGFILPKSAVVNSSEGAYVIKVKNGIFKHISITTSNISDQHYYQVFGSNLNVNDSIILNGSEELRDNAKSGKLIVQTK